MVALTSRIKTKVMILAVRMELIVFLSFFLFLLFCVVLLLLSLFVLLRGTHLVLNQPHVCPEQHR